MRQIIQVAPAVVGKSGNPVDGRVDPAIRTDGVYVVFTSFDETLAGLRVAAGFSEALGVPVTLVHLREVPYEIPLDAPTGVSPVESDEFVRRLQVESLVPRIRVCLCRDSRGAITTVFKPNSLVVVGGRCSGWWPTPSTRWRRALEAAGHFVVPVDTSNSNSFGEPPLAAA